ncbi:hypothetical protein Ancab_022783 [Ancistrocladus abbreviatus]
MANKKSKEDEKIEKIIRNLLKLTGNRRCINCNSLGPQYVCTTFWTFVCTNCSGVHREFTHRVKSVSMAKFSLEEVNALQAGGNEQARQIYFKTWDPACNVFPDSSNIHGLHDFIKHVYVDRRYTGEKPVDRLPRLKLSDRDDCCERRGVDTLNERYSSHRRNDDRNFRYSYDLGKSYSYSIEGSRSGNSWKAPADARFQDYDPAVLRRSATQMFTTADIRPRRGSPSHPNKRAASSPPTVRRTRELLGEHGPVLRVGDQAKSSDRRVVEGSAHVRASDNSKSNNRTVNGSANSQSVAPSISQVSADDHAAKNRNGKSESLIKFQTSPAPSDTSVQTQAQQMHVSEDTVKTATSGPPTVEKAPSVPNKNTLEFLLFELSTPADAPGSNQPRASSRENTQAAGPPGSTSTLPMSSLCCPTPCGPLQASPLAHSSTTSASCNMPTQTPVAVSEVSVSGMTLVIPTNDAATSHAVPHAHMHTLSCTSGAPLSALSSMPIQPPNAGIPEVSATGMTLVMPSNGAAACSHAATHACTQALSHTQSVTMGALNGLPTQPPNAGVPEVSASRLGLAIPSNGSDSSHATPMGNTPVLLDSLAMTASLCGVLAPIPSFGMARGAPPGMVTNFLVQGGKSSTENPDRQQFPSMQQLHRSASSVAESRYPAQHTLAFNGVANNQPAALAAAANSQEPHRNSSVHSSQSAGGPLQDTNAGAGAQPYLVESKSSGRRELPADLFTGYPSCPASIPGWQTGAPYGMAFNMQYHPASIQAPALLCAAAKPRNPFDFNDEESQGPVNMFPSIASLQGALANVSAPADLSTSAFGAYPSALPFWCIPGAYMGQHSYGNMPPSRLQGLSGYDSEGVFGSSDSNQQAAYEYPLPTNPSSFPTRGGNPFG